MMKLFQKKSKQGITLVESVLAVLLLGFAASGILTLLLSGGTRILKIGNQSSDYSEATRQLDLVISAVSNGYGVDSETGLLDVDALKDSFGDDFDDTEITSTVSLYDAGEAPTTANIRGWYLELEYGVAVVSGFAADSKGVFDN